MGGRRGRQHAVRGVLLKLAIGIVVAALALPVIGATPLACAQPCVILAHSFGYVSPATELRSGDSVRWQSLDGIGHPQAEMTGDSCFVQSSSDAGTVRFDLTEAGLTATDVGETKTCATAVVLPDGSAVLPYRCLVHVVMRGALLVTP